MFSSGISGEPANGEGKNDASKNGYADLCDCQWSRVYGSIGIFENIQTALWGKPKSLQGIDYRGIGDQIKKRRLSSKT